MLVLFLAHLVRQIRVEFMLATVRAESSETALATLRRVETADRNESCRAGGEPELTSEGATRGEAGANHVLAPRSGFLTGLDEQALLRAAVAHDMVIALDAYPGCFLVEGTPIGRYWPGGHADVDADDLTGRIRNAVRTGPERTEAQDIGYGLRQLTDVAVKALSPGINDPTTAVHAMNHVGVLLCQLATLDLTPLVMRDDRHRMRVVLDRPDFGSLLDLAFTQPRRYGAADPVVLGHLLRLLADLAWHCRDEQKAQVTIQLERLIATTTAQDFHPTESARLQDLATDVRSALAGSWASRAVQA